MIDNGSVASHALILGAAQMPRCCHMAIQGAELCDLVDVRDFDDEHPVFGPLALFRLYSFTLFRTVAIWARVLQHRALVRVCRLTCSSRMCCCNCENMVKPITLVRAGGPGFCFV